MVTARLMEEMVLPSPWVALVTATALTGLAAVERDARFVLSVRYC
jgi:hypothetical protein